MCLASTLIVWQDPIMNWAPIAVYNPQLWHWPEDWPLVRLSPTVEPFVVIGYATFYFGPFFPAIAILRRLQARASAESFVWRRPLVEPRAAAARDRLRLRRDPRDLPRPHRALHLLAGDAVGLALRRDDVPVPADLGVRARHGGDDSRRRALLPRRHRTHAGREAGAAVPLVPEPPGARHVPDDVR